MSHYEDRLQHDLDKVRKRVQSIGEAVIVAVRNAVRSVLACDPDLATETILGDLPINRQSRRLDRRCHRFVARHLPSAGHLRFITSVMRLSRTLERVGDYAETISRATVHMTAPPPDSVARDIEMLGRHATHILGQSLEAFRDSNVEKARATRAIVGQFGATFDKVFSDLVREGNERARPLEDLFSLMAICNRLERTLHQGKNICEQTLFAVAGEEKEEKTFDVLFIDERNAGASMLAEHYCRKAYPESGSFESAGWQVAAEVDNGFVEYGLEKGIDLRDRRPVSFDSVTDRLSDFDLIIDLADGVREHINKIPFHTSLLRWSLEDRRDPAAVYQELVPRVRDLMALLRGEDDD